MSLEGSRLVLSVLRTQAWERAKGELQAVLMAFEDIDRQDAMHTAVQDFVELVEQRMDSDKV
jgi:hypothetical protein